MKWLDNAAASIAKASGKPVTWTMPMGLPATQPYHKSEVKRVRTILGRLNLQKEMDEQDESAVVDTRKQRAAFSPNYIHSLDSAHMMKTAIACRRRGLVFAAVHDSFWTHPSDVDEMNVVLRDKFVELHSVDLLEQLLTSFRRDFPEVEWDADPALALPPRGDLDLEEVKKSTYFFA
jgi:DNA-directed RNA polymerase